MADDFQDRVRPLAEGLLESGEQLTGICAASEVGMFKGSLVALVATDRRLIIQKLDRKFQPTDEATSIAPGDLASAGADGLSGGWPNLAAAAADRHGVTLKLRTTSGEKRKLMMMRGGEGMMGKLGGGEQQRAGIEALAAWFAAAET